MGMLKSGSGILDCLLSFSVGISAKAFSTVCSLSQLGSVPKANLLIKLYHEPIAWQKGLK